MRDSCLSFSLKTETGWTPQAYIFLYETVGNVQRKYAKINGLGVQRGDDRILILYTYDILIDQCDSGPIVWISNTKFRKNQPIRTELFHVGRDKTQYFAEVFPCGRSIVHSILERALSFYYTMSRSRNKNTCQEAVKLLDRRWRRLSGRVWPRAVECCVNRRRTDGL